MTTRQRFLTLSVTALAVVGVIAHVLAAPPPGKGKLKLALTVTVDPTSITESAGSVAAWGTVTHNNTDKSSEVFVTLSSSDPTEATVPAGVTIPEGFDSATFPITAIDDSDADGDQTVTITATATHYRSATANLTVEDDDSSPPATQPSYSITLLGTLGGAWSVAIATNELGDVVGVSEMADGTLEAFVYFNDTGTMHRLHDLVTSDDQTEWKWRSSIARGINSLGQICMEHNPTSGGYAVHAVRISLKFDEAGHVVPAQGIVEIVAPHPSSGWDINELGDVTGSHNGSHAFLYTDEFGVEDIGDLGGGTAGVDAINNVGECTGLSATANGELHAFRFTPTSGMEDLGVISSNGPYYEDMSWGRDLNDLGVVVGSADAGRRKGSPTTHAFREAGQGMIDLGTLGGSLSYARSINSDGAIIGMSYDKDDLRREFLYTNEFGMVDLEPLITNLPANTSSIETAQINDENEICGRIWFAGGTIEAFLLTPNP